MEQAVVTLELDGVYEYWSLKTSDDEFAQMLVSLGYPEKSNLEDDSSYYFLLPCGAINILPRADIMGGKLTGDEDYGQTAIDRRYVGWESVIELCRHRGIDPDELEKFWTIGSGYQNREDFSHADLMEMIMQLAHPEGIKTLLAWMQRCRMAKTSQKHSMKG